MGGPPPSTRPTGSDLRCSVRLLSSRFFSQISESCFSSEPATNQPTRQSSPSTQNHLHPRTFQSDLRLKDYQHQHHFHHAKENPNPQNKLCHPHHHHHHHTGGGFLGNFLFHSSFDGSDCSLIYWILLKGKSVGLFFVCDSSSLLHTTTATH